VAEEDIPFVARCLGIELARWEAAGEGQGRTAFAETTEGREVVVKWFPGQREPVADKIAVCEALRGRGYPAPATVAHGAVGDRGQGWIQERLPGEPCHGGLDRALLEQVMAAIELQADAAPPGAEPWSYVGAVVFEGEEGWWQKARARGSEAAAMCDRLDRWVRELPRPQPHRDLVHLDLNFTNLLVKDGKLTGIVDLDHLGGPDDRSVDLVTLVFNCEEQRRDTGSVPDAGAMEILRRAVLDISGEPGWRQAVTYRAVCDLGWTGLAGDRLPLEETLSVIRAVLAMTP
jgi:hypothetical protein